MDNKENNVSHLLKDTHQWHSWGLNPPMPQTLLLPRSRAL